MTDKEKIRAEIERRMNCYDKSGIDIEKYFAVEDEDLLEFIDTMQEESVSGDLEEAARNYGDELDNVISVGVDDDNSIGEYATQAFKAGAQWQKEQMMKDAIETTIVDDWQYGKDQDHTTIPAIHQRIDGCKVGDKVKVIVIKEDEQ